MEPSQFITSLTVMKVAIVIGGNWRISSLVANENGPWYIFKKFRDQCLKWCEKYPWCAKLHLYELVECEWCNSIWFCSMTTILWYLLGDIVLLPLLVFCMSAGVIVIKYVVQTLESICNYFEKLSKESK
jgi:hypothetical protein